MRWRLLVILVLMGMPCALWAQGNNVVSCAAGDTVDKCFEKNATATKLQPQAEVSAKRVQESTDVTTIATGYLATMNTGAQSLAAGATPSTNDYANDFIALLESSGLGERSGNTLTFQWGFPMRAAADKKAFKISVALTDPSLDPKVAAALTGDVLAKATGSLDQMDNVTYAASWAFMKRNPKPTDEAMTLMRRHVVREVATIRLATVRRLNATYGERVAAGQALLTDDQTTSLVKAAKAEADAAEERVAFDAINYVAKAAADAADEQKQFSGQITYHERAALIGAKEIGGSLTFEMPTLQAATKRLSRLSNASDLGDMMVTDSGQTPTSGSVAPKFTFKAEYKQVLRRTIPQDFALSIPTATLNTLNKASAHSLSLSAVAGWKFKTIPGQAGVSGQPEIPDRIGAIDFNGTFENDSSDPKKKNRLIATLTFTQQLSDHFTIPVSLRYASHESDLSDVNKRFSAHFGVSYKIPPANPTQKAAELAKRLVAE